VVATTVTRGAPHYLVADGRPQAVRRTRGGDAWQARAEGLAPAATPAAPAAVALGMPAVGRPA
jgi:tRNA-2-methylthio-N6-dimethylallyladenosine synthase